MHDCWQGQFSVESFTLLIWKPRHGCGGEMSRVDSQRHLVSSECKALPQNNRPSHLWTAVRYFWLVLINRSLLSYAFRCWELITSMNIWWIIRSLILLVVVVILFSSHSVAVLFLESFNVKVNVQIQLLWRKVHTFIYMLYKWFSTGGLRPKRRSWVRSGWVTDGLVKKGNNI